MCLDRVRKDRYKTEKDITVNKVFRGYDSESDSYITDCSYYKMKCGEINIDRYEKLLYASNGDEYHTGFHTWATKCGANSWTYKTLREFYIKCKIPKGSMVTEGYQDGYKVYVTNQLYVPEHIPERTE